MDNLERKIENLLENGTVAVPDTSLVVGRTYPILGTITAIEPGSDGELVAIINKSIVAKIGVSDLKVIDVLKQRAFETGIFVCTITSTDPNLEVKCQAAIFGKNQSGHA